MLEKFTKSELFTDVNVPGLLNDVKEIVTHQTAPSSSIASWFRSDAQDSTAAWALEAFFMRGCM